jgi:hypothetical protein
MPLRYPNRTAQAGVYRTGSPNYVDVSTGSASTGMVTFDAKAADDSWADGDTVGVLVSKDDSNYWVGIGTWDATNSYVELTTEEEAVGTLSDTDAVVISAVLTSSAVLAIQTLATSPEIVTDSTTARTLSEADNGKTLIFTNAAAVTVTTADTLPVGFHCLLLQVGAGLVSVDSGGSDTINGDTAAVDLAGQYKSGYLIQNTEGAWVLVA